VNRGLQLHLGGEGLRRLVAGRQRDRGDDEESKNGCGPMPSPSFGERLPDYSRSKLLSECFITGKIRGRRQTKNVVDSEDLAT
jgi:hypothetical protein